MAPLVVGHLDTATLVAVAFPAPPLELRLSVPAECSALEATRSAVMRHLAPHRLDARARYVVELVLEEMLTNVVQHAGADAGGAPIDLHVCAQASQVRLMFDYAGVRFDPSATPVDPVRRSLDDARVGGRGLALMHRFASAIAYERRGNRNHVTIDIAAGDADGA